MMGRLKSDQGQLFYEFCLGDAVPEDHLVRKIDTCACRKSNPNILVMQSTQDRTAKNVPGSLNTA
jgi:hypothetical protein